MKTYKVFFVITCILLFSPTIYAERIYKWIDENGVQCFSNGPPTEKKEGIKIFEGESPNLGKNYERTNEPRTALERRRLEAKIDSYEERWRDIVSSHRDFDNVLEKVYNARITEMENELELLLRDPETYFYSKGPEKSIQTKQIEKRLKEIEWQAMQDKQDAQWNKFFMDLKLNDIERKANGIN